MKDLVTSRKRSLRERGMATAEYAVGTLAVVSFGAILIKILTDATVQKAMLALVLRIFEIISSMS